jgi:hypothetical protein
VIDVLGTMDTNLQECTWSHQGRKSSRKDATQYWYDESTHKILKRDALKQATHIDDKIFGREYSEVQEVNCLEKICHECPTIDEIHSHVKDSLDDDPYDVFLVHAGYH